MVVKMNNDIHSLILESFKNVFTGKFYDEFLMKPIELEAFAQWEAAEHCYYSLANPEMLLPEQVIPFNKIDLAYAKEVMAFAFQDRSELSESLKTMKFSDEAIKEYVDACSHFVSNIQNIQSANKFLN